RDFGLLPPSEVLLDAQILRRSKGECLVLVVSAPKPVVEGRIRLLERAAVKLRTLDVAALAVLNATLHLARLDPRELLVTLDLQLNRWLTDELRLESPFEVIDPFRAAPMTAAQGATDASAGPEYVQAFGLALRAL